MRRARKLGILAVAILMPLLRADVRPEAAHVSPAHLVHAHFNRGVLMLHSRRYELAAIALQHASKLAPHVPEVQANLGFALIGLEQWVAAQAAFERALGLNARQVNAYYGLALAADGRGDRELALGAMRTFVHLAAPDDPFVARARAALWEWQTQPANTSASSQLRSAEQLDIGAWRGRVAIVNAWAIWCAPCRAEMPDLERLSRELDQSHFVVAGIAAQSDEFVAREWLRELKISFPNFLDERADVVGGRWGVKSYPETLVFDPDGRLAMRLPGTQDWSDAKLRARLEALSQKHKIKTSAHRELAMNEKRR